MKINRNLDNFRKNLEKAEKDHKEKKEKSEQIDELELIVRFDRYKPLKYERLKKHGQIIWDFALDAREMLPDEFEFYLCRILLETTPESRYQEGKEHWYFHEHSAFPEMDKGNINASGCKSDQCVPECKYYKKNGKIEDEEVINYWMNNITIIDLDQYKEELGEELYNKIMNYSEDDENGYDIQKMRQECINHDSKINENTIKQNLNLIDENTILQTPN